GACTRRCNDAVHAVLPRPDAGYEEAGAGRARRAVALAVGLTMLAGRDGVQSVDNHRGSAPDGTSQAGIGTAGGGRLVRGKGHGQKPLSSSIAMAQFGPRILLFQCLSLLNR